MDLNKTFNELMKNTTVPRKYFDQTRLNAPMHAVIFDFLASEGYDDQELEMIMNNKELLDEIALNYIEMKIREANTSYQWDWDRNGGAGIDNSTSYNKSLNEAGDYYWQIKDSITNTIGKER